MLNEINNEKQGLRTIDSYNGNQNTVKKHKT